ncbi:peptidylprolyl isomerase [Sphingorhabdus sp. Alg239-R122]|uniref:peptidylprolyl isomerase n=1 Tax=Sphingorhabdus sp. Alg239-R122 TaxID=2305989 RepID=UPI0013DB5E0F|nr:peptidylprolyl isomerase [Sphingorhabdus sp. Alg239-R122]
MKQIISTLSAAALLLSPTISHAQEEPEGAPSPGQIVAGASAQEWVKIDPEDLVVMTLAPDAGGNERKVVIQLMPAPFSQGWVQNIRALARAKWYDNISVNRVQDNYVVQWGDPNYDNPEAEGETKALPGDLKKMTEDQYAAPNFYGNDGGIADQEDFDYEKKSSKDPYAAMATHWKGFPVAGGYGATWPVHCYGMVGVGRGYSPDTGSGAELYTVIGHAPRHLDRNIALVGRIIEGMEHLSSLPRGKGVLGFYGEDELDKRTPILTVRVAGDLPEAEQPHFEYLGAGKTFAKYADARANRRDPFFIVPAGGADICNIPIPVRRVKTETGE